MTFAPETIAKAQELFKETGLSQEAAQKLVDFQANLAKSSAEAAYDTYNNMRNDWRKEVFADKALGNGKDGLSAEASKVLNDAITRLGDQATPFREALSLTGVGDNPAFLRGMFALGKLLGEGKPAQGGKPSPQGQRAPGAADGPSAKAMYPSLPSSAG